MFGLRTEPSAVTFAIRAVIYALLAFDLIAWSDAQVAALLFAVDAVLSLFVRQAVTSQKTLERAGTSAAEIHAMAKANDANDPSPRP